MIKQNEIVEEIEAQLKNANSILMILSEIETEDAKACKVFYRDMITELIYELACAIDD